MPANRIKVSIAGRFLLESRPTGTHRSALGFSKALITRSDTLDVAIYTNLKRLPEAVKAQLQGARLIHSPLQGGKLADHLWEQFIFPNLDPAAVHLYLINTGPFLFTRVNHILAVHDIYALTSQGLYNRLYVLWNSLACGRAAQKSRYVVCFTEYVKNEISRHLSIPPRNLAVMPQGPGLDLHALPICPSRPVGKYFLCVGGLQPHKNLRTVILSFASSGLADEGFQLLVIGRRQANFSEVSIPKEILHSPWLEFTGYVGDGELIWYYQHAVAFVHVSLLEGFGLPLVESFHLGCPVITSNVSCLPEVAGDAALFVDPLDEKAVAAALRSVADTPSLRSSLIEKGRLRAEVYTWQKAGEKLADQILEVAGQWEAP